MESKTNRMKVLTKFGASRQEVEELLNYNTNVFKHPVKQHFPLDDEMFIATWRNYEEEAKVIGVFAMLKDKLVQLQFPIRQGISEIVPYQTAIRSGANTMEMPEATGLSLKHPDLLELIIHQTSAGNLPVLIVRNRNDFVTLVQALARKNEPKPIPDAMGACMIAGYNNWDRIQQYKKVWKQKNKGSSQADWKTEFQTLVANKELYQDRFMILSNGPYSGVRAEELQLSEDEWRRLSLIIRREHEAAHYFTQRVLGSMRNNMMDELIADYIGITSAVGEYKATWFLRFVGLEKYPNCRVDGRIHTYRDSLSDGAFYILQKLIVEASYHLENWNSRFQGNPHTAKEKAYIIQTLAQFTLEELASAEGFARLVRVYS